MSPEIRTTHSIYVARRRASGIALFLALVVLVLLTTMVYATVSRIALVRHRQQFIIDYQNARYACDSGMKYALTALNDIQLYLVTREHEPDFSDVFIKNKAEYDQYLADWALYKQQLALQKAAEEGIDPTTAEGTDSFGKDLFKGLTNLVRGGSSSKDSNSLSSSESAMDVSLLGPIDPNSIEIPGPYGPEWPLIKEPIEFELGDARIKIEIEDENAKLPLIWSFTSDEGAKRAAGDATDLFCEWMQMGREQIADLKDRLNVIAEKKAFSLKPKPVTVTSTVPQSSRTISRTTRTPNEQGSKSADSRVPNTVNVPQQRSPVAQSSDFARLLHSSIIDLESLSWPLPNTGKRYEAPIKYLALWGSSQVNINTAPRHVLEAAFMFGGNYVEIAEGIIKQRRQKPFKDTDELQDKLYTYGESIRKALPYITTTSSHVTLRVTARCGAATASSLAAVVKSEKTVQTIAMIDTR